MTTFQALAKALCKPGAQILAMMTPHKCHLNHMAMGVAGEAGELVDAVKRYTIYNKPLDRANVIEELGDLRFYMAGLMEELSITDEEVLAATVQKLGTRYASGSYSDKQAQERADKGDNK